MTRTNCINPGKLCARNNGEFRNVKPLTRLALGSSVGVAAFSINSRAGPNWTIAEGTMTHIPKPARKYISMRGTARPPGLRRVGGDGTHSLLVGVWLVTFDK